jgi:hypothetical protein
MERPPKAIPSVSVVIPTLNEAARLPGLFDCLDRQSLRPGEVVVADAGSTDGTVELVCSRGARVVEGGRPAVGRNAGARAATGDLVLFLDADSRPPERFVEMAVAEFVARGLSVAGAPLEPIERRPDYVAACWAACVYLRVLQHVAPHASGSCVLVTREIHERIGGFDESLALGEDHDYVRRASRCGRFRMLKDVSIPVSMRRVQQEGYLRLGLKYAYCEVRTLVGSPIRRMPFAYEFAAYHEGRNGHPGPSHPEPKRPVLPSRLRRLVRTLQRPSTEVQADAIGIAVTSVLGGGAGAATLLATGAAPSTYLPVAGVALATAGLSAYEAARKLRYERHYGDFFMASLAVASDDLFDDDGNLLAARGIDEIWELHVIGNISRMAALNRQGHEGRLTLLRETLEGMRAMLDDEEVARQGAKLVTARSDVVVFLLKIGFEEVSDPPPLDLANRLDKRLVARLVGRRVGRDRSLALERSRMAVITVERFLGPEFRRRLDAQIFRLAADVERAKARTADVPARPR